MRKGKFKEDPAVVFCNTLKHVQGGVLYINREIKQNNQSFLMVGQEHVDTEYIPQCWDQVYTCIEKSIQLLAAKFTDVSWTFVFPVSIGIEEILVIAKQLKQLQDESDRNYRV